MALTHVVNEFKSLSLAAKIGIGLGVLLVLMLLIGGAIGIVGSLKDRAYQKREAKREEERQQLESEKATLQAEKQRALTEAADANARAETYKQVAESKRSDRKRTIKELEQVERDHEKHKQDVEAAGKTMSDAELRDELCKRLAARGYPPCPR